MSAKRSHVSLPSIAPLSGRVAREPESEALIELIRLLRQLSSNEQIDEGTLEKLELKDAPSRSCARLIRLVQKHLRRADLREPRGEREDVQGRAQLAAQMAFLERKMAKIYEKLKKRTSSAVDQAPETPLELSEPRETLVTEVETLRASAPGTRNRPSEHSSPSPERAGTATLTDLQARVVEEQLRHAALTLERDSAEASAAHAASSVHQVEEEISELRSRKLVEKDELSGHLRQLQRRLDTQSELISGLMTANGELNRLNQTDESVRSILAARLEELKRELLQQKQPAQELDGAGSSSELAAPRNVHKDPSVSVPAVRDEISAWSQGDEGAENTRHNHSEEFTTVGPPTPKDVDPYLVNVSAAIVDGEGLPLSGVLALTCPDVSQGDEIARGASPGAQCSEPQNNADPTTDVSVAIFNGEGLPSPPGNEDPPMEPVRDASPRSQRSSERSRQDKLQNLYDTWRQTHQDMVDLEQQVANVTQEMEVQSHATQESMDALHASIREVRDAGVQAIEKLRKEHQCALEDAVSFHHKVVQQMVDDANLQEQEAFVSIGVEMEAVKNGHLREVERLREDAMVRTTELEARIQALDAEARIVVRVGEISRREREFRGLVWLTVRRSEFKCGEFLAVMSDVLGVNVDRIRIIDDDVESSSLPQGFLALASMEPTAATTCDGRNRAQPVPQEDSHTAPLHITRPLRRKREDSDDAPQPRTSGQDKTETSADDTSSSPLNPMFPGSDFQCLFLEFVDDGFVHGARLMDLLQRGDPRVELLRIVHGALARGSIASSSWHEESAVAIGHRGWQVGHRHLVVTALSTTVPLVVKIVAFDEEGRDFMFHLDEEDVHAIAGRPKLLLDALLPSLRVIDREGRVILAALQEVVPTPSFWNGLDRLIVEETLVSAEHRRQQRKRPPPAPPPIVSDALIPHRSNLPESGWTTMREEVLDFAGRFVLVTVSCGASGSVRLTLQDAGSCEPFSLELPGRARYRQQRIYSQVCDLGGLTLSSMLEQSSSPPLLIIRLNASGHTETVLCMSDWREVPSLIGKHPTAQRQQLFSFLQNVPPAAVTVECFASSKARSVVAQGNFGTHRYLGASWAWSMLAQRGRRIDERLYVVRVYHRPDPHSQFMVCATETDSCEEWRFFIPEDQGVRSDGSSQAARRVLLAADLVHRCRFTTVAGRRVLFVESDEVRLLAFPKGASRSRRSSSPTILSEDKWAIKTVEPGKLRDLDATMCEFAGVSGARPDVVLVAGRFVDWRQCGKMTKRTTLHTTMRRFGELTLLLTLQVADNKRSHVLSAYHPHSCTLYEVVLKTRDRPCPEKFCMERAVIAGVTLTFVLSETAFPHAVHFLVRDAASPELRITVRDEAVFDICPLTQRQLLTRCAVELLETGVLRRSVPKFSECSVVDVLDEDVIPVFRTGFSEPFNTDEDPLVCSTRLILNALEFHVSLTRRGTQFTIGFSRDTDVHLVHLADLVPLTECPTHAHLGSLGMHAEVCEVGGVVFLLLLLADIMPRALRVAILDVASQRAFQFVVLDAAEGDVDPSPTPVYHRYELLDIYRTFVVPPGSLLGRDLASRHYLRPAVPALAPASQVPSKPLPAPTPLSYDSSLIHRATWRLPSGQPVALSVVRELMEDATVRFHVQIHHPVTSQETDLLLESPLLDRILKESGTESSASLAERILEWVTVHPDGQMEIRSPRSGEPCLEDLEH